MIVSSSLSKFDSSKIGRYNLGLEYNFLPGLGMTTQLAVFHSGGWTLHARQAVKS